MHGYKYIHFKSYTGDKITISANVGTQINYFFGINVTIDVLDAKIRRSAVADADSYAKARALSLADVDPGAASSRMRMRMRMLCEDFKYCCIASLKNGICFITENYLLTAEDCNKPLC